MIHYEVRPGITGWAQSLFLDIKINALTLQKIVKREGISQPGQATMEEFKGQHNQ